MIPTRNKGDKFRLSFRLARSSLLLLSQFNPYLPSPSLKTSSTYTAEGCTARGVLLLGHPATIDRRLGVVYWDTNVCRHYIGTITDKKFTGGLFTVKLQMSKDAESRLLHETPDRKPEFAKMKPPVSAWITGLATIVALIACMGFSILFQKALSGFSKQVNAFVSIGDFSSNFLQAIVFIITAAVILYLLFIYLASGQSEFREFC
nr:unnamed protein product [Haemonchus contortus]